VIEKTDWERLEKLRAPISLSIALQNLGLKRLKLVRKELRSESEREWVSIDTWLKGQDPFMARLEKNEIGRELMRKLQEELQDEAYRSQKSVFKTNQLGIGMIIVPLVLQGDRLGFLLADGFTLEDPAPSDVLLEERLRILMFREKENQEAFKEWRDLPCFNPDKRLIINQMLELLAREVVKFFEETQAFRDREVAIHKHTFSQMVTAHLPLRTILKRIPQMAESNIPVLIVGEPGTGRELLAQLIHDQSPRKKAAFKTLHCTSITENLLEAELLGYEKGAFAGAYTTKIGLFEACHGGTLYLEEIGDLSLSMQHKIFRVILDGTFSRLGSTEIMKTDVRIVASTQRNLKKLVQMGVFREELYYRLNVQEIELPPLRQRREDIGLLAEHFLQEFMKSMKKEGLQWTEGALQKLQAHSFSGNVRELRNEVERLVALKDSHSMIQATDLSAKITESLSPIEEIERGHTLKQIIDEYEKQIISEALAKYHWNRSRVAELFQITRQGLLKKIAKFKLDKRKSQSR
jgi:transcriptional regulator with PAS, ATPase and Fis domain